MMLGNYLQAMPQPGAGTDQILQQLAQQGFQNRQSALAAMLQPKQQQQSQGGGLGDLIKIAATVAAFI